MGLVILMITQVALRVSAFGANQLTRGTFVRLGFGMLLGIALFRGMRGMRFLLMCLSAAAGLFAAFTTPPILRHGDNLLSTVWVLQTLGFLACGAILFRTMQYEFDLAPDPSPSGVRENPDVMAVSMQDPVGVDQQPTRTLECPACGARNPPDEFGRCPECRMRLL